MNAKGCYENQRVVWRDPQTNAPITGVVVSVDSFRGIVTVRESASPATRRINAADLAVFTPRRKNIVRRHTVRKEGGQRL